MGFQNALIIYTNPVYCDSTHVAVYIFGVEIIVIEVPRGSSQFLGAKATLYRTGEVKVKLSLCMP
jgi:hypothetical protein